MVLLILPHMDSKSQPQWKPRIRVWLAEPTPPPSLVLQGSSGTRDAMSRVPGLVCDLKATPKDLQGVQNCLLCERK